MQNIKALTNIVWDHILDYNNYAKMVLKILELHNYKVEEHHDSSQTLYTRMKVGFGIIKLTFYVEHEYVPKLHLLMWTLDYIPAIRILMIPMDTGMLYYIPMIPHTHASLLFGES